MAWIFGDQYYTAVLFTGTFALTYVIWNKFSRKNGLGNRPPSIGYLPILCSLPYVPSFEKFHRYFHEKRSEFGDVVSFQTWHEYIVVLSSDEAIREALVKQSTDSADRPAYYINDFLNLQRKGIIDSYYHAAFKNYHQLSLSILKEFGFGGSLMESRITLEVEDLIQNFRDLQGAPVYAKALVASCVMSVISSIALGDRLKEGETKERLVTAVDKIFESSREALLIDNIHWLRHLPHYKRLLAHVVGGTNDILNILENRIEEYRTGSETRESFISSFMSREGEEFDMEQLKYTLRDFMLAGYETSSTTLQWILVTLANEQEVQERLHNEMDSVVPRNRLPALEDKAKLPYLEATILEVMRTRTLVPTSLPRRTLNDICVKGYTIPKKAILIINLYAAHMDSRTWEEPERFKPERFLDSSGTKIINKEKVISFSLGKRSCLGELLARQEIYLFIAGLLQQFHILPPEGQEIVQVEEIVGVTVAPSPYLIRFIERN